MVFSLAVNSCERVGYLSAARFAHSLLTTKDTFEVGPRYHVKVFLKKGDRIVLALRDGHGVGETAYSQAERN